MRKDPWPDIHKGCGVTDGREFIVRVRCADYYTIESLIERALGALRRKPNAKECRAIRGFGFAIDLPAQKVRTPESPQ